MHPSHRIAPLLIIGFLFTACSPVVPVPLTATDGPATLAPSPEPTEQPAISTFGQYAGYSQALYDGWQHASEYVTATDGVRLAVDITRPTLRGELVETPLPVVWTHTRYQRAFQQDGQVMSLVDFWPELQTLVKHGYIFVTVDVRGSGASFGRYEGFLSAAETGDAYTLTEWLGTQPWSSGKVGMWGGSYLGMTQYMAASRKPPHLTALFPAFSGFDIYDVIYPGGIFARDMVDRWGAHVATLDQEVPAPPVDADVGGELRDQALAEHAANWDIRAAARAEPRRSANPQSLYTVSSPATYLTDINASGVPIYHVGGWLDGFTRDTLLWYANVTTPQKMLLGPWSHNPDQEALPAVGAEWHRVGGVEMLRWFDYWLKGIDNGVMQEAPIHFATVVEPGRWTWQSAAQWPPTDAQPTTFEFAGAAGGGWLGAPETVPPSSQYDELPIDPTASLGSSTRWQAVVGQPMRYPDLVGNDAKGLSYTTPALTEDVTVTGSPIVTLYVTATQPEVDFHVYLEEIDEAGRAAYVTEGELRASHRALALPTANYLGLPYHRGYEEDLLALSASDPAAIVLDLLPTSNVFNAGHRLRVTITTADAGTFENLHPAAVPTIFLYHSAEYPSAVVLPVQP